MIEKLLMVHPFFWYKPNTSRLSHILLCAEECAARLFCAYWFIVFSLFYLKSQLDVKGHQVLFVDSSLFYLTYPVSVQVRYFLSKYFSAVGLGWAELIIGLIGMYVLTVFVGLLIFFATVGIARRNAFPFRVAVGIIRRKVLLWGKARARSCFPIGVDNEDSLRKYIEAAIAFGQNESAKARDMLLDGNSFGFFFEQEKSPERLELMAHCCMELDDMKNAMRGYDLVKGMVGPKDSCAISILQAFALRSLLCFRIGMYKQYSKRADTALLFLR